MPAGLHLSPGFTKSMVDRCILGRSRVKVLQAGRGPAEEVNLFVFWGPWREPHPHPLLTIPALHDDCSGIAESESNS